MMQERPREHVRVPRDTITQFVQAYLVYDMEFDDLATGKVLRSEA